jgi:hypothetical protein
MRIWDFFRIWPSIVRICVGHVLTIDGLVGGQGSGEIRFLAKSVKIPLAPH